MMRQNPTRNQEVLLYLVIAVPVLLVGVIGFVSLIRQVGHPFVGVILTRDFVHKTVGIDAYTPSQWIGIQQGLQGGDVVLAINGYAPQYIGNILTSRHPTMLIYRVFREGAYLQVSVPLTFVSLRDLLVLYGLFFLSGFFSIGTGLFLLKSAKAFYTRLISFSLLMIGTATLYFLQKRGITGYYWNPWLHVFFFIPAYPFLSALLIHLFFVFPSRFPRLSQHRRIVFVPYIIATLISVFLVIGMIAGGLWNEVASLMMLAFLVAAVLSILSRGIWVIIRSPERRAMAGGLVTAFGVGLVLTLGLGVIPLMTKSFPSWLNEYAVPLTIIYPFLLGYTAKNAELVDRLQQQVSMYEQLESEARELKAIRERTLQEIADILHDTIISDVRGLQLWLQGMKIQQEKAEHKTIQADGDLQFIEETLEKVYWNARRIMEGAKIVDFTEMGLVEALEHALDHLRRSHPHIKFSLRVHTYDEAFEPRLKEEVFWIIQSALINACEHAAAQHVIVSLAKENGCLRVVISDDGIGFDVTQVLSEEIKGGRRRLGVRNMFARASRIRGQLSFANQDKGTRIVLVVPLDNRGGSSCR